MKYQHLAINIKIKAKQYKDKNAIYYKDDKTDSWVGIPWNKFDYQIKNISKALLKFGIKPQQNIAIFAQNIPEWIIADLAIMSIRAVTVPIYATNSTKEVEYIVNDAEISVIFVGEQMQYDEVVALCKKNKYLKLVVALRDDIKLKTTTNSVYLKDFSSVKQDRKIDLELQKRYDESSLSDLACIIYTSGTTGEPKGVMLDHANFADTIKAHDKELNYSDKDTSLSFLPLTHVFEHNWVLVCLHNGIEVYFNENPKFIANALKEVKPNYMCAVPRFFEKIYSAIEDKKNSSSSTKIKLFDWALDVGNDYYNHHKRLEKSIPFSLKLKNIIADKLVHSKLKDILGGNIKMMPCGGAPIDAKIVRYFHSIGINVKVGYGLTETMATVTLFGDNHFEFDSVGKPINGTEIKIGENNEILVKGPGVMKGYYQKPDQTKSTFIDGWLKTGDAGKIDEFGNLYITDRIKDLMKTSGGKYIAPQKLETAFVNDSFIEQIAIIGDQKKFVSALTVPDFETLKKYAEKNKIRFDNIEDLITNNQIIEMFRQRFEELQKNFSGFEKIKKFTLLPKEFTIDAGELTATLKLKRKVIAKKYKELIDKMYGD
ncbi:MAG: long-chain fatty acid--CoA ligase [Bacteroidota bacterium]